MNAVIENAVVETAAVATNKTAAIAVPEFCMSNFYAVEQKASKAKKPSDKERKAAEVEKVVAEGEELCKQHETYYNDYVVRGNKALYDLQESIYAYALRINESQQKEQIIERMRKVLKESYNIKTTAQTHWLTTVVKFIVRTADRQTASNYSKVLQVAFEENLAANELAAYIERRGGIMQVRETEAAAAAKGKGKEIACERLGLLRKLYESLTHFEHTAFKYDGNVVKFARSPKSDAGKEKSTETGSFCHFLTVFDPVTDEYRVVAAADFGKTFENVILKHMLGFSEHDTETIRKAVERFANANDEWLEQQHMQSKT